MIPSPGQLPDCPPPVADSPTELILIAVGAVAISILLTSSIREALAAVRARRTTARLHSERQDALNAVDNLANTADDVIMFPEGSKERPGRVMVLLLNADTRIDLQERLARAIMIIDELPYDEPPFQALEGSWALEEGQQIVAQEFAELEAAANAHQTAVNRVTYARWNVPFRLLHATYQLFIPDRWMDGHLPTDTSRIESIEVNAADTDGDATDYMVNVNDTTVSPESGTAARLQGERSDDDGTTTSQGGDVDSLDMDDLEWVESTETNSSTDAD